MPKLIAETDFSKPTPEEEEMTREPRNKTGQPTKGEGSGPNRRELLQGATTALSAAAGASLLQGCRRREEVWLEQPVGRTSALPGASIYRGSVCLECPAACGVTVRTVDGDAKKLEGTPGNPVGLGGLCALGQSSLQELYHPDRVVQPLRRVDGSDELEEIDWETALSEVATAVLSAQSVHVITGRENGPLAALWQRFAQALGAAPPAICEPFDVAVELEAVRLVFGFDSLPAYDLAASDWVLSIGAPLLDRWRSPVHFAKGLAKQRGGRAGRRGKLVQMESRHSLTAATADEWVAVRPGTEGVVARALGGAASERLAQLDSPGASERIAAYRALYPASAPDLETAAQTADVPVAVLSRLVDEMLAAERPLVIAGGSAGGVRAGVAAVAAGLALDVLLGVVGASGTVRAPGSFDLGSALVPSEGADRGAPSLRSALDGIRTSSGSVVLVADADPVAQCPAGWQAGEALDAAGYVIALTTRVDSTAGGADLVLPVQTGPERWSVVEPFPALARPCLVTSAPSVESLGEARHPGDLILAMARAIGDERLELGMTWEGFEDAVEFAIEQRLEELPEPEEGASRTARRFVGALLDAGYLLGDEPVEGEIAQQSPSGALQEPFAPEASSASGDAQEFRVLPFESVKAPRGLGRPWLQELPDPLSTVVWDSWVEVAVADAHVLHLASGDRVRLTSGERSIEVGVVVSPAARPGTLSIPVGFGQPGGGRYSANRGADVNALEAGEVPVEGTEVPAWLETMVHLEKLPAPAAKERLVLYGRPLGQPEHIPSGWAPQPTHGPADEAVPASSEQDQNDGSEA